MAEGTTTVIYCLDTSALVTIQRTYPRSIFPGLWDRLDDLVRQGRLVAPREVYNELEQGGDDDIFRWAREQRTAFVELDADQVALAKEIINDPNHQGLVDLQKETPDADPFVIALAVARQRRPGLLMERWVVVSDEARAERGTRPRIPAVCRDPAYQAECIRTLDLFKWEGWQF